MLLLFFLAIRIDYYYDQSEMYTKFSDWIPKRLHQWQPRFVEDFWLLVNLRQHYNEEEIRRNIYFLKTALKAKFRHPSQALCKIRTPEEYHKYRLLFFMHIHFLIMRSYLRLGSLFDKRHLYFYNLDFAPELEKSFQLALGFYKEALTYWQKVLKYAQEASQYKFYLRDLAPLEGFLWKILHNKIDLFRITSSHIQRVEEKLRIVRTYLAQGREK